MFLVPSLSCQQRLSKLQLSPNLLSFSSKPSLCPSVSGGTAQREGWDLLAILFRMPDPQGCPGEEEIPGCSGRQEEEERQRADAVSVSPPVRAVASASIYPVNCHPTLSPPGREGHPGEFSIPWGSWQGGSSSLHKLCSRTYHEVQLLLVPRVKASPLTPRLLHAQRLHQVDAELLTSLPADALPARKP